VSNLSPFVKAKKYKKRLDKQQAMKVMTLKMTVVFAQAGLCSCHKQLQ
jgi:peroxiredoxin